MILKRVAAVLVPVLVLVAGLAVALLLVRTRPQPSEAPPRDDRPLVEVTSPREGPTRRVISATGTVIPARQVVLQPEVSGQVEWRSPALTAGGQVKAGEPVVRIDRREFALALEQQRAALVRARAELEMERSRLAVARREWELFRERDDPTIEGRALQQRELELQAARAAVEAAESELGRAQLSLQRTEVIAPFDAHVLTAAVEVGQSVGPQTQLATLAAAQPLWVEAALDSELVTSFDLPGPDGEGGARAHVWQQLNGDRIDRRGRVMRLIRTLEEGGQTARVVIELDPAPDSEPMLFGAFVRVAIAGSRYQDAWRLPAEAIRQGDRVWVVTDQGRLESRQVRVGWYDGGEVILLGGVHAEDRVVTSALTAAADGMPVRATEQTARRLGRRNGNGQRGAR